MVVVEQLSGSELVKAVALVGSRIGDLAVPDSDYDVFICAEGDLADLRAEMADELADASSWRSVASTLSPTKMPGGSGRMVRGSI
jgi:hypothetical protein